MATLSISLTDSAIVTGTKNYTVSDADLQRVLDWAAVAFAGQLPVSPTNQQVMLAWVQTWINGTKDAVRKNLQDSAAAIAIGAVPPVDISS